ncbi:MAG: hypothetical protein JXR44_07870 [Thiotrichales bacterium]|nr:hypothetical protein [Thiotrichales bacterium]
MKNLAWQQTPCNKSEVLWQYSSRTQTHQEVTIEFIASGDLVPEISYQHCLINLAAWDAYWQKDLCNYVPEILSQFPRECCANAEAYQTELAQHQQKIERWQQHLIQNRQIPAVCFEAEQLHGRLRIRQGRHRIAYLRQLGLPVFAAAIPEIRFEDVKQMRLIQTT